MTTTWNEITIGTGNNAVSTVIVTLPPMDSSPTGTKGNAFDYLVNTHSNRLTFGELQTAATSSPGCS